MLQTLIADPIILLWLILPLLSLFLLVVEANNSFCQDGTPIKRSREDTQFGLFLLFLWVLSTGISLWISPYTIILVVVDIIIIKLIVTYVSDKTYSLLVTITGRTILASLSLLLLKILYPVLWVVFKVLLSPVLFILNFLLTFILVVILVIYSIFFK